MRESRLKGVEAVGARRGGESGGKRALGCLGFGGLSERSVAVSALDSEL